MKIRLITEKDNLQLCQLIRQILEQENLALPGTAYYDESLTNLSAYYQKDENTAYFVVTDETEKVYGGAGIGHFSEGICELQKLYLLPELRGQGWAKKLMDTVLSFAQNHYEQIYLESHTNLSRALELYKKYGFTSLSAPLSGSEHSLMNVWMLKKLPHYPKKY